MGSSPHPHVPNAPCGVEIADYAKYVELGTKVPNAPCGVEIRLHVFFACLVLSFLMHRVELKYFRPDFKN